MANSLACVLPLQKSTSKHGDRYISPTKEGSNVFTLDSEMYITEPFWENLVNKSRASYPDFDSKADILKHMRTEFLDNLSKARKADFPKMSRDSVVNLMTPTKPTMQGNSNDPLTKNETKQGSVIDLRTPCKKLQMICQHQMKQPCKV